MHYADCSIMKKPANKAISRKEFLKQSSSGLISLGLLGGSLVKLFSPAKAFAFSSPVYRTLGRTGFKVTPVGCGATRTMEPAVIKAALDAGMNFIDTGRNYFNGQNEVMIGKIIEGIRHDYVIQSKISLNIRGSGEELKTAKAAKNITNQMQRSLEESLKALRTDYIDIMLLHNESTTDFIDHESVREFFTSNKQKGTIRSFGYSSHSNFIELLKGTNNDKFYDVVMVPYNHKGSYIHSQSNQYSEWDQPALEVELKKAEANNIGIVAMKTCSAGPHAPDENTQPSFAEALKWILQHSYIATMAVAVANLDEVAENIRAMS